MDSRLILLLSAADRAIAGLDSATDLLPDPDRFVYSYVRREAVLSSQIEGTQSSLDDLVRREAGAETALPRDTDEVSNYVAALNEAMAALPSLPVSSRLIRQAHARLMQGARGGMRRPGEFRQHQVHIGTEGASLRDALFVPPAWQDVEPAMAALEHYLHAEGDDPPLIRIGLAHAQFETIHPFWDGNGRCGRLLISLLLAETGLLRRPVLYLSLYFKQRRAEYYERLQATRDQGDWEGWLCFFLQGVIDTARDAQDRARRIVALREDQRNALVERLDGGAAKGLKLLESLYQRPHTSISEAAALLDTTFPTAQRLVEMLETLGILEEVTGQKRNRIYLHRPYIDLFS